MRIAFVSSRSGREDVWTARADGRDPRRVTRSAAPELTPTWSPDGRTIAYSRDGEIWVAGADGRNPRALVHKLHPYDNAFSPTWHGHAILYASNRAGPFNQELYRVPARRLTFTRGSADVLGDDGMPDFSPDGRLIAFVSNRTQEAEIWMMRPDGSGQRRLVRHAGDDFAPSWSPDGLRLAFSSPTSGLIYAVGADGHGLRALTRGELPDWRP